MIHISIIGAGLGGLCLAQALQKHGVAFDVYEKDASPYSRAQGYRLRIDESGQRALAQCLPADLYALFKETCAVATTGGQFVDAQLRKIQGRGIDSWRASAIEDEAEEAHGDLSANRLTLREVLLSGISDRVHFAKSFSRFDLRDDGKVIAFFEDGSSAHADILIAADGVNSRVREQRLPQARPADTGSICIYGKTTATREAQASIARELQAGTSVIFADGFAVVVDAMRFRDPPSALAMKKIAEGALSPIDDYFYWAFIGPRDRLVANEQAAVKANKIRLASIVTGDTGDWHPGLRALFELGDPESLAIVPVRSATPGQEWRPETVTFLGDAIHVMSPAGGLGANTALEDALVLSGKLAEITSRRSPIVEALAAYEQDMRTRATQAIRASQEGAKRLFAST
jgi:2-polyprenyl-6-methoxyphenol hydroxylase-like FAD-dependent oxidoreductase